MSTFRDAYDQFQRGELAEAETTLTALLQRDPENADAVHLLAGVRHALGDLRGAAQLFARARELSPYDAEITFNLAAVLSALGRHAECIEICTAMLQLRPEDAETLLLQGASLAALGRHDAALACYERVQAERADLFTRKAAAFLYLRRAGEALGAANRACDIDPINADARYQRAMAFGALNRWEEAVTDLDRAIAIDGPRIPFRAARAPALANLGRFDEALADIDAALQAVPQNFEYVMRRAYVLSGANRTEESLEAYTLARRLRPADPDAQYAAADLLLSMGDFARGLPLYEIRLANRDMVFAPPSSAPRWTGAEPLEGKTILVQGEQGFGDLFQFSRLIAHVSARGARVMLQERPQTLDLLRNLEGVDELIPSTSPAPAADFHIPLLSLPLALGLGVATIPGATPYLSAEPSRVERWRQMLGPTQRKRIGIVWSGVQKHASQKWRSIDDEALPLLLQLDAELISLQMEESPIAAARGVRQFGKAIADFAELAALIETLDLVVTIDTGVAHLAGALGKPVYVMLPYRADWRWLRDRTDTPWYPNMRIFRQPKFGDWQRVIADVRAALQE